MNNKKLQITVSGELQGLKNKTKTYFESQGFKKCGEVKDELKFQRGSTFQNYFTFNPLNWKSKTNIKFQMKNDKDCQISLSLELNTVGQTVTQKEIDLWDIFLENYGKFLKDENNIQENKRALKNVHRSFWKYIGWAFVGSIIFAVPTILLAHYTGRQLGSLPMIIGGIWFMQYMMQKNHKSNK